ncbi:MAG: PEP-CTERM sorting domain-containing protein [Verrucomicrobiota bacterium]|jgi:hypothetical protein
MKMKIGLCISITFASLSAAWAQGTVAWCWNNTDVVVNPTDQILLTGTITNDSAQPYVIPASAGAAAFWGDLQPLYSVFWEIDFYDKTVPANGTLFFNFGTLTPIAGAVEPGIYPGNNAWVDLTGLGGQSPLNTFEIAVVPEPNVIALFGLGTVLALCWVRGKRKGQTIV